LRAKKSGLHENTVVVHGKWKTSMENAVVFHGRSRSAHPGLLIFESSL
jgi:hypothetical protein